MMGYFRTIFLAVFVFANVIAAEQYFQWGYYKNIIINSKATGAGVATTVQKFPLLIRLTPANADVFDSAQSSGQDIRFAGASGNHLPYQIERWNKAAMLAEIWVLADSVAGNDSVAAITMYWGQKTASDSSRPNAVFDTTNGFQAVYHLAEETGDTIYDATVNHLNGIPKDTLATLPSDTPGIIGPGMSFNGSSNGNSGGYFVINNSANSKVNFSQNGNYTISAWAFVNQLSGVFKTIVCKNDLQWTLNVRSDNRWEFNVYGQTTGWQDDTCQATALTWTYVTGVRSGTNQYLYKNGILADGAPYNNSPGSARDTITNVDIGRNPSSLRFWSGKLDEIRLENVSRSANWIKLCNANQQSSQTLIILGASMAQTPSGVVPQSVHNRGAADPGISIVLNQSAQSILFRLIAAPEADYRLRITDISGRIITELQPGNLQTTGNTVFTWNRRSASGASAAPGLYIAQLIRGTSQVVCKAFFCDLSRH